MAVITLKANKFLGALTNLIAYSQVADTHEKGQVNEFVRSFQDINVENGDGKVVLSTDLLEVDDLSGTSTLLTRKTPNVDEQYIDVTQYKVVKVTLNRYLMRGAFVDENQLATFMGYIQGLMQETKIAYLSGEIIKKLAEYVPTQSATQEVTIDVIDTTTLTDPVQLQAALTYNANKIQKEFIKTLNKMGFPTNKYNDASQTETIDFSSLKLIIRGDTDADILVDSLATLLNSNKITDAQKWDKTYVVPNEQFEKGEITDNKKFEAWLMHNKKIQYGYFYEVATSFFDASTLDTHDFLHFAIYLDIVKAFPAVCFKLNNSIKPSALAATPAVAINLKK